ncbi:hypothetical protein G7Y89_g11160 [Cudoniella acicularis]|uniref:Uncharacterized protein n=1 Tax=Cudoniella acicularis TaxID=354080 RepID=A0A8H4RCV8_9HELO|nr:hypothetical protein G7Y89_g11160 [Cudoniella acicularis]
MMLNGMNWMNYWDFGWGLVGGGDPPRDVAIGLAAASTFNNLRGLPPLYTQDPAGWYTLGIEESGYITSINTIVNGSSCQTTSVQTSQVTDIFNDLQANGPQQFYKNSQGWNGFINLTVPILTTTCVAGLPNNSSVPVGTLPVKGPLDTNSISPILVVPQAFFPIGTWIVDNADPSISVTNYGASMNTTPISIPSSSNDITTAQALSMQFGSIVSAMNGLTKTGLLGLRQ